MLKQSHLCRKKVQYFIAHEEISQIQEASIVRIHHRSTVKKYSSKKITKKSLGRGASAFISPSPFSNLQCLPICVNVVS